MRRKCLHAIAAAALSLLAGTVLFGQTGELRGKVVMQQADGRKVPVAGAEVDVFRVDMSGKYNTQTNRSGEFILAGVPIIGTYVVAGSHAGAKPNSVAGVRSGREIPIEIILTPGDGKRLTYEEIKAAGTGKASNTGGTQPASPADIAKQEELRKQNAAIEAQNQRLTNINQIIGRTFRAGNEALTAANLASKAKTPVEAIQKFTLAVEQYDEGLRADAEQPAILTNKAVALKGRGVERYNLAVASKTLDDAGKTAMIQMAKDDFGLAAEASGKAVTMIKAQPVPTDPSELARYNGNKYAAMLTRAESMRLFVTKGSGYGQSDVGITAFNDYIAIEPDPAKKLRARVDMAQMLLDSGNAEKALTAFRSILAEQPDQPQANLGAALAIYGMNDKSKFQQAANYLQHYIDVAADSDPLKDDAKAILTELKNTENIVPKNSKRSRKQ